MKYKNLFWGIVLIVLGILYLLKQFDVIWFSWRDIFDLWPLLLLLWGVSILPMKPVYRLLGSVLVIIAMALLMIFHPGYGRSGWHWTGKTRINVERDYRHSYAEVLADLPASLELDAAAGKFIISGTTGQLVEFMHSGSAGSYYMSTYTDDERQHVRIGPERNRDHFSFYRSHDVEIRLNTGPEWEIDIDAGAAAIDLDLSHFIVNKIKIDGGATSITVRLGSLAGYVMLDIDTGVSSVTIELPDELACELNTNTFMVSKNLPGFDKVSKNTYVTPNFASAEKNVNIRFESAISSLKIVRY
jgi:hypothetical protein